jgi:drug/metabolite transporter (DMT)-like permease
MTSSARLRLKTYLLILMMIIFGPSGDVLLGKGMKRVGGLQSWEPAQILHFFGRAFASGFVWLGIGSLLTFFVAYLLVLSWADYSYVQPASALAYGVVALLSYFALGEVIKPLRWAGVIVICLGVFIVGHTHPNSTEH